MRDEEEGSAGRFRMGMDDGGREDAEDDWEEARGRERDGIGGGLGGWSWLVWRMLLVLLLLLWLLLVLLVLSLLLWLLWL